MMRKGRFIFNLQMGYAACITHAEEIYNFVEKAEKEIKDKFAKARNYDFVRKAGVLLTVLSMKN